MIGSTAGVELLELNANIYGVEPWPPSFDPWVNYKSECWLVI